MAEPLTPEQVADIVAKYNSDQLEIFNEAVSKSTANLGQNKEALEKTGKAVVGLGVAISGAKDSYTAFANSWSGSNFASLSDQLTKLTNSASVLGVSMDTVLGPNNLLAKVPQLSLQAADSISRLEKGIISAAGSSGQLGQLFGMAGKDLGNMTSILRTHAEAMRDTGAATGYAPEQVQSWYASIAKIPGGLEQVQVSGSSSMNMLTAALKVADGTGRDLNSVVQDLTSSYETYGLKGQDALKFSASISQVAMDNGIQFNKLQSALQGTASAFKGFADTGESASRMAQGSAEIINTYVESLKKTGVTGERATEIIGNMTNQVAQLTTAQKAFLSAQSGGPGGLMGAFQIEKLLDEGKITEVFQKVQTTMRKQIGPIVSLEQAGSSTAAAEQFQRQITMLRSGPLGSFAKTDQDARRILESMRTGSDATKALRPEILKETVERGNELQKPQITLLSQANDTLEQIRINTMFNARDLVTKLISGGTEDKRNLSPQEKESMEQTMSRSKSATTAGGVLAQQYSKSMASGDASGLNTTLQRRETDRQELAIKDILKEFTSLPEKFKEILNKKTPEQIGEDIENVDKGLFKDALSDVSDADKEKFKSQLAKFKKMYTLQVQQKDPFQFQQKPEEEEKEEEGQVTLEAAAKSPDAAVQYERQRSLRVAATRSADRGSSQQSTAAGGGAGVQRQGTNEPIHLAISAICVKCQNELDHQLRAVGGAAALPL